MIRFIVDTTFCLTREYAKEHKIEVVFLKMILDGIESDGGFSGEWSEFYARLKASNSLPTTSQPNPDDYMNAINKIYSEDENAEIIILTIASLFSGTINSALLAAKSYPDKKIAVVDSMNATLCCKLMIEELVEFAEQGKSFEQTLEHCEYLKTKLFIQFVPDTMKYLKRGGKIGTLSALFAGILSVKPVFDVRKNKISIASKVLGLGSAAAAMVKRLPEKIKKLYVCFIEDNKNVPVLLGKLNILRGIQKPEICPVDPIFGAHVGIGAIGLACLEE